MDNWVGGGFAQAVQTLISIAVVISSLFTLFLLTAPSQYNPYKDRPDPVAGDAKATQDGESEQPKRAWKAGRTVYVVVLGDIGRSPRMQYHAISIAKHGGRVFLIGYTESELHPEIISNSLIHVVSVAPAPSFLRQSSKLLFPIIAPLKALWQAASLYRALCYGAVNPARWILVQNPPSIPTLAVAKLVCLFRNSELVIDWHNFGYSILGLKLGPRHPLVRIATLYEKVFSRFAAHNITVTHAMARVLQDQYGVKALTLYDRPASLFRPLNAQERANFLARLPETAQYAQHLTPSAKEPWKLIVSATSWTPDEDFSILLDALSAYSAQAASKPQLPKILAIITGKGPLKEHYLSRVRALNQENKLASVVIQTAWLTPEDYALLLGAADLGVSLHTSSSGVDLPMKVVDMFGAGLPVVGWNKFEAWPELVQEGVNGKGFTSSDKLWQLLVNLFEDREGLLDQLKEGAVEESKHRWDQEWDRVAGDLFKLV
ncbi:glycosyltransferase family 33 protein [Sporormia fimetaria CBS 119925]|uniref:Chitobiosyldiphosphodolichol beta-mannosyltransferase n=1 Tax=Sporormia fimetaria CBS 119925 TaxID=1340428 RepID=A0A6A6V2S9_9PLEO|nr:glycosyltransferase family 33 protein [Sporormia fimetaria CBS 119925]